MAKSTNKPTEKKPLKTKVVKQGGKSVKEIEPKPYDEENLGDQAWRKQKGVNLNTYEPVDGGEEDED